MNEMQLLDYLPPSSEKSKKYLKFLDEHFLDFLRCPAKSQNCFASFSLIMMVADSLGLLTIDPNQTEKAEEEYLKDNPGNLFFPKGNARKDREYTTYRTEWYIKEFFREDYKNALTLRILTDLRNNLFHNCVNKNAELSQDNSHEHRSRHLKIENGVVFIHTRVLFDDLEASINAVIVKMNLCPCFARRVEDSLTETPCGSATPSSATTNLNPQPTKAPEAMPLNPRDKRH